MALLVPVDLFDSRKDRLEQARPFRSLESMLKLTKI
jgi:hypothetical protein